MSKPTPHSTETTSREAQAHLNSVFVAYHSGDENLAHAWVENLVREGVNAARDETIVAPGEDWEERLREAIRTARAFIVLLSPGAIASKQVRKELEVAADVAQDKIVPVQISNSKIEELLEEHNLGWLRTLHIAGARRAGGSDIKEVLERLKRIDPTLVAGVRIKSLRWVGPMVLAGAVIAGLLWVFVTGTPAPSGPSLGDYITVVGVAVWILLWWYNLFRRSNRERSNFWSLATVEYDQPHAPIPVFASLPTALAMLGLALTPWLVLAPNVGYRAEAAAFAHLCLIALFGASVQQRLRVRLIPIGTLGILFLPIDALRIVKTHLNGRLPAPPSFYDVTQLAGLFTLGLVIVYDMYHKRLGLEETQQPIWLLFLVTSAISGVAYFVEATGSF
jgi:hypothetical protein